MSAGAQVVPGLAEPVVFETGLEHRAAVFAAQAHGRIGQRRKYTHEPYICHPAAVAALVRSVAPTPAMLAAARLHDTVEDTPVTIAEINTEFGDEITDLVAYLTKVTSREDGPRAVRQSMERAHIAQAPAAAKTVKLADISDNISDIVERDPQFARLYLTEKLQWLDPLRGGSTVLWQYVESRCIQGLGVIDNLAQNA